MAMTWRSERNTVEKVNLILGRKERAGQKETTEGSGPEGCIPSYKTDPGLNLGGYLTSG